jgi:imidazole glycerol phosphate synthase glutamine amidotransferase subunit
MSVIGVIDYGAGNLGSVMNALERLGAEAAFVKEPGELSPGAKVYDRIIFPGDGRFDTAMAALNKSGYSDAIRGWIADGRPFLGICIGMQLLFEASEEAPGVAGLGVIQGAVKKFPCRKIPQIGWNETEAREGSAMYHGVKQGSFFYYIHSFYCAPADDAVSASWTDYEGTRYTSAVERGSLWATQFHPEKSGEAGLALLRNWLK